MVTYRQILHYMLEVSDETEPNLYRHTHKYIGNVCQSTIYGLPFDAANKILPTFFKCSCTRWGGLQVANCGSFVWGLIKCIVGMNDKILMVKHLWNSLYISSEILKL